MAPKKRGAVASCVAPALQAVTPYLCCKGAAAALDFSTTGFGAVETMRITGADGAIGHAEIRIHGALIMISDEWPEEGVVAPSSIGGTPVAVYRYLPDVDAVKLRAVEDSPHGDRTGTIRDPFGHRWMIATSKETVSKAELAKRFGGAFTVS